MKKDEVYLQNYRNGVAPPRPVEITEVLSLFLRSCQTPFSFSGELHEQWELVYVRRGAVSVTADDKVYHLTAGKLIFHRPMEFHQLCADRPGLEIFVASFRMSGEGTGRLERSVFNLLDGERAMLDEVIGHCCTMNGGVFRDDAFWDCRHLWKQYPLELQLCVNALESLFCRFLLRSPTLQAPKDTADSLLYRRIVALLEEHLYGSITIRQVAQSCGVSESTVKACFQRHAGCGVHKYLLKIKLRAAIRMIGEGSSVSGVSDALGFSDPNYFSYVFKRETGRRPTDFRK